jgi:hypothetical protein
MINLFATKDCRHKYTYKAYNNVSNAQKWVLAAEHAAKDAESEGEDKVNTLSENGFCYRRT